MVLENEICSVKIFVDEMYTINSSDNPHYDIVYNLENLNSSDFYKTLGIWVDLFSKEYKIAMIGDYFTYASQCALLDNEILTILRNDVITQINVLDGTVVKRVKFDCIGCNFAIYKVLAGYVVYGEMEIIMLNNEFNKMWSFSGKDIFVSNSGKEPFELCEDKIKLYDFEDNYYEIDFEGKLIIT